MEKIEQQFRPPLEQMPVVQTAHPVIYADQVVEIGIGAFVSRITFGVENRDSLNTTMTLVIPTDVLLNLGLQIQSAVANEDIQKSVKNGHMSAQKKMTK